jgi:hypothetical protein
VNGQGTLPSHPRSDITQHFGATCGKFVTSKIKRADKQAMFIYKVKPISEQIIFQVLFAHRRAQDNHTKVQQADAF